MEPNARKLTPNEAVSHAESEYFQRLGTDPNFRYSKQDLDAQIREAFRRRNQTDVERHVENLAIGKGLGDAAHNSLKTGLYNPRVILEPLTTAEKRQWVRLDLTEVPQATELMSGEIPASDVAQEQAASGSPRPHSAGPTTESDDRRAASLRGSDSEALGYGSAETSTTTMTNVSFTEHYPLLEQLRCTYRSAQTVLDVRSEVESNLATTVIELDRGCSPFTFQEVLQSMCDALAALERGDLNEEVALPLCVRELPSTDPKTRAAQMASNKLTPLFLQGVEEVLAFVKEQVFPIAYDVLPAVHAAQWATQYTIVFLKSVSARNLEEAETRVALLASGVRILGDTENFSAVFLSLQAIVEEYDAFTSMRATAEKHLFALLDDVENTLLAVLKSSFPNRRARLQLVERGIRARLQRALLFINEIDYNWTPSAKFHIEWKCTFVSHVFYRIHRRIAPWFVACSFGFIDNALYKLITDVRLTGRYHSGSILSTALPQVPLVRQVEYERLTEHMTFPQIGMAIKRSPSILIGLQICMGARYVLRQSTAEFDEPWGFHMDEANSGPSKESIDRQTRRFVERVREKVTTNVSGEKETKSDTFLTQME